jgi:hypothetical protein
MGVQQVHGDGAIDYAVSDISTLSNAIPFDAEKYADLFRRAL